MIRYGWPTDSSSSTCHGRYIDRLARLVILPRHRIEDQSFLREATTTEPLVSVANESWNRIMQSTWKDCSATIQRTCTGIGSTKAVKWQFATGWRAVHRGIHYSLESKASVGWLLDWASFIKAVTGRTQPCHQCALCPGGVFVLSIECLCSKDVSVRDGLSDANVRLWFCFRRRGWLLYYNEMLGAGRAC